MQRFPFTTLPRGPLNFSVVMDGANYSAAVSWNIQGQRWFLTLTDRFGVRLTTVAVVESAQFKSIESLSWNGLAQRVTATMSAPHGFPLGSIVEQTIRGAVPDSLNGVWEMNVDSPTTLSFAIANDPGSISAPGSYGRNINLVDGYFTTSVLCYRSETFFAYP